ncbi:MAG: response regulator transcription factor [Chlorobi bacterium]|nr:response regulator transcription factor [Chlorobiota bacterium]
MKILIIEDQQDLLEAIVTYLGRENNICEGVGDFDTASEKVSLYQYDVIILDIMLPDGNGLDLIPLIKKENAEAGVIIVSARNALDDKISGLDLGADDYLTKPFHLSELNARVKAVWRRKKLNGKQEIVFSEIKLLPERREVYVNDKKLTLTRKEYDLLLFFISNPGRILTKEAIAEHLWGDYIDMADHFDFIYTHLNNLRRKIKQAGGNNYVQTVYGVGYKWTNE